MKSTDVIDSTIYEVDEMFIEHSSFTNSSQLQANSTSQNIVIESILKVQHLRQQQQHPTQ